MAKLPTDVAEETAKAETGYALMEEGDYELELIEVRTEKNGQPTVGPNGPYWTFIFQIPEDAERYAKRRFWVNFSHSEKAASIRKSILDSFGVGADVDTDDLIGKRVFAHVHNVMIEQGTRAGEEKDDVKYFVAAGKVQNDAQTESRKGGAKAKPDMF